VSEKLLTIDDLCVVLGKHRNTVYEILAASRKLPVSDAKRLKTIRFGEGRNTSIHVSQEELDRWLKALSV